MKTPRGILIAIVALTATLTSCTTSYDAYGRPVQSVDPGAAVAGAAAAGALGYAIGRNNDDDRHYNYYRGGYSRNYYHRRGFNHRRR